MSRAGATLNPLVSMIRGSSGTPTIARRRLLVLGVGIRGRMDSTLLDPSDVFHEAESESWGH